MNPAVVERDERVVAVENASYRWAAQVMSFGLLLDAIYRSWVLRQASWDLLGLVIAGGAIASLYQANQRALGRGRVRLMGLSVVLGAVIAVLVALSLLLVRR